MAVSPLLEEDEYMSQEKQADDGRPERALKALGDALRRAAKNADSLDLKPEVKAWLLDQFGPDHPRTIEIGMDKRLEYSREIIRQQEALEQQTSGKKPYVEREQQRRESKETGDNLPPH